MPHPPMTDKRRWTTLLNSAGAIAARFEFMITLTLAPILAQVFFWRNRHQGASARHPRFRHLGDDVLGAAELPCARGPKRAGVELVARHCGRRGVQLPHRLRPG